MCSTPAQRIVEIGQAIDDLAADARTAYAAPRRRTRAEPGQKAPSDDGVAATELAADGSRAATDDDTDRVVLRLARLWEQLAELDPEVARRLAAYRA